MAQVHKPITPQLEGVGFGMHSPRPFSPDQSASNSLLGQPPSAAEERANEQASAGPVNYAEDFEEQQFDDAVASIYVSTPQDPLSYIREEKLDDKEIMLMDGERKIAVPIKQVVCSMKLLARGGLCGPPSISIGPCLSTYMLT